LGARLKVTILKVNYLGERYVHRCRIIHHETVATRFQAIGLPGYIAEKADRPAFLARRLGHAFTSRAGRRYGQSNVYLDRAGTVKHAVQFKVTVSNPI
jgi:hypothetical protein